MFAFDKSYIIYAFHGQINNKLPFVQIMARHNAFVPNKQNSIIWTTDDIVYHKTRAIGYW